MAVSNFLSNVWQKYRGRATTAADPVYTDVYIVEFPKSGVTWLANILSNVALLHSGRSEVATFGNFHWFIPDIYISRDIGAPIHSRPPCRLIKSHSERNLNYNFVIYLVRNPLAVMKSYFRFMKESAGISTEDFHRFCTSREFGIPAWRRHVNSWLTGPASFRRLHLIRYEDLQRDALREVLALSDNYGWSFEEDKVRDAVIRSGMQTMRDSEELYRKTDLRYTMRFIGGQDDFEVAPRTAEYIQNECERELRILGFISPN